MVHAVVRRIAPATTFFAFRAVRCLAVVLAIPLAMAATFSAAHAGRVGPEFPVNTYTAGHQRETHSTGLADGGFVVVWQSAEQDGSGEGVYGQRYDSSGVEVGSEFRVNRYRTDSQYSPAVAGLSNGGFVVVWTSDGQDGDTGGVYGQRYRVDGTRAGAEFRVNTFTVSGQNSPAIAPLTGGGFVVAWQSFNQDSDGAWSVFAQRFNAAGVKVGNEFRANTSIAFNQEEPSIAGLTNGGFVVVWKSDHRQLDGGDEVYGQRFDKVGNRVGREFRISTKRANTVARQKVTHLTNGGFVVVWTTASGLGISGQRYNGAGARVGDEFSVYKHTEDAQAEPSVAGLLDGGFVVTWYNNYFEGMFPNAEVLGRRFRRNGLPAGGSFRVNRTTMNFQTTPSVAVLKEGGFVVTWESQQQDSDGLGVFGQRFNAP